MWYDCVLNVVAFGVYFTLILLLHPFRHTDLNSCQTSLKIELAVFKFDVSEECLEVTSLDLTQSSLVGNLKSQNENDYLETM